MKAKNILEWFIKYTIIVFIVYTIILFFGINMFRYNSGSFYFSLSNLSHLSFSSINKELFYLFSSFLAFGSIVFAFVQWKYNISVRRQTDINGLLEEIHHNFNIVGDTFVQYKDKGLLYSRIYEMLKNQKELVYPNPDNPNFNNEYFDDCIQISTGISPKYGLISLRNAFIKSAITSDNIFNLTKHRIYINLNHLDYSIDRHNLNIKVYNSSSKKESFFPFIQNEYRVWVLFRLSFMLVDLIMNSKERDFINKEYVKEIKGYIES